MASRARLVAPFALAALSVVAALSLGRVVDSDRFVLPVIGAALVPHAIGALVRWRGWSKWLGLLLTAIGLVVYVVLALEPSTTTLGIPGADTWHAIERQLSGGWHLLRTAPAPARTTDGAILLAVLAVWCMAALADWLAFWRHTTLAALSPALVFFVWTSTLGTDDTQLVLTIAFCAATAGFLLAQNLAVLDRRRSWLVAHEPVRAHWFVPAAVLTTSAIVLALVLAPLVPGADADPILDVANAGRDGGGGHSYHPAMAPFVDIGKKLDDTNDVELFTVRAAQAEYWRIAALDSYTGNDGGQWTLSAEGDGSVSVGLPDTAPSDTLQQRFDIGPLGERWLPAAYRAVAIDLADTLVVRSSGTLVADADEVSGLHYTVASKVPLTADRITPAQQAATAAPVPSSVRPFLALPKGSDIGQIAAIARQVVNDAGATTPYAQAQALRDYFRDDSHFVYDTSVGSLDTGSAILQFLRNGHGFCVQFASAYAVMARSLGIPARVAVGFTPGTLVDGAYHVTSHDAHAWPEVYLNGLGWTHLFDPTPSSHTGATPGGSDLPVESTPLSSTQTTVPPPTVSSTPSTGTGTGQTGDGQRSTAPATGAPIPTLAPASSDSSSSGAWLPVLVTLAILVVLAIGYATAVVTAKRRRRARRHGADDPARGRGCLGGSARPPPRRRVRTARSADAARHRRRGAARHERRRPRARSACSPTRTARRATATVPSRPTTPAPRGHRSTTSSARSTTTCRGRAAGVDGSTRRRSSAAERRSGAAARVAVACAQLLDERLAVGVEVAHLGLDLVGEAVDGDEQRELPTTQGVEDLTVVVARPDGVAVGHEAQAGEVVAGAQQLRDRPLDARHRQPGVEQRTHHAQRHEVAERVPAAGILLVGHHQTDATPRLELRGAAAGQASGLDGGVPHAWAGSSRPLRTAGLRGRTARATGCRRCRACS